MRCSTASSSASARTLADAEPEIAAEAREERAARDEIAAGIDAALVKEYERCRAQAQGVGVARLVGTTCQGCHLTIPAIEAEQIKKSAGDPLALLRQLRRDPGPLMLDAVLIYFDGGARGNPGPAAIGAVVLDPSSAPPHRLATVSERIGETTNNVAEYQALIAGLEAAAATPARVAHVRADSKLVIEQLAGRWKVKQPHLKPLHARGVRAARTTTTRSTSRTCDASRTPKPTRW